MSPRKEYSPLRRAGSRERIRRISVSPRRRRSRSPSFPFRKADSPYNALSPKRRRLSPSPIRGRKPSLSPRRRFSPVRSKRISVTPQRSPLPYHQSLSPIRLRSPVHDRRPSLSPRRKNSPVKLHRPSLSPRKRSFSPRRTPPRMRSPLSPKRRLAASPLRRDVRRSLSPGERPISPRKKSLSPCTRQSYRPLLHQSPPNFKYTRETLVDRKSRDRPSSPRKLSPFSKRPLSPWKNQTRNLKRSSVSPKRFPVETKTRRSSISPKKSSEAMSKQQPLSPRRSPKRLASPKRNVSPGFVRKSSSPRDKSPLRKSSPLVVRQRRAGDSRRSYYYRETKKPFRPSNRSAVVERSRSPSLGPSSPGRENLEAR